MSTVLARKQTETTGDFPAGLAFTAYAAFRVALRKTQLGSTIEPFWQAVGVHRAAEFSKSRKPLAEILADLP